MRVRQTMRVEVKHPEQHEGDQGETKERKGFIETRRESREMGAQEEGEQDRESAERGQGRAGLPSLRDVSLPPWLRGGLLPAGWGRGTQAAHPNPGTSRRLPIPSNGAPQLASWDSPSPAPFAPGQALPPPRGWGPWPSPATWGSRSEARPRCRQDKVARLGGTGSLAPSPGLCQDRLPLSPAAPSAPESAAAPRLWSEMGPCTCHQPLKAPPTAAPGQSRAWSTAG